LTEVSAGTHGRPITAALSPDDPAYTGQARYTARFLRVYDTIVLRFNGQLAWRCPPRRLVRLYDELVSSNHLDIGVGTGYFLDKCRYPTQSPGITLMDLNRTPLEVAAKRLHRFQPRTHQANALEPFGLPASTFESVGLNWLLHCLPGNIATKSAVFDHCKTVLAPGGVVFGSTVLSGGVRHTRWSRWLMERLNRDGTFTNRDDDLDGLKTQLNQRFDSARVEVVGALGIFSARS
jgi:ubiquinone/menaquinone biosynthesis C-methylase UbiE